MMTKQEKAREDCKRKLVGIEKKLTPEQRGAFERAREQFGAVVIEQDRLDYLVKTIAEDRTRCYLPPEVMAKADCRSGQCIECIQKYLKGVEL